MAAITASLIGAGVAAAGSLASSAIAQGAASAQGDKARQAAAAQAAYAQNEANVLGNQATNAANQANNSQQTQATNSAQALQAAMAQQTGQSNGLQNQSSVFNQLQGVANGQGPNPAQAMLAQATSANTANQAALMAGQRGAGANVGLIARQAAQQGAANQQNSALQGATLQAQQSLGALNQLGGIAGQQVGQQLTANQQSAQTALANQQITSGATLAGAQMANQAGLGAMGAGSSAANQANQIAGAAQQQATNTSTTAVGGALNGLGAVAQQGLSGMKLGNSDFSPDQQQQNAGLAQGGEVKSSSGPRSYVTHHIMKVGTPRLASGGLINFAQGGKVPAMVSPEERYLPPNEVKKVLEGKKAALAAGMKIKGKAKYPGNDYRNDTVSKTLQEGGIVIPNSITKSSNSSSKADQFVKAVASRSRRK